jgi:dephospho-CoA kinase
MKKETNCLRLGVTGGIASGKTTVAKMLETLGVPAIDFDILARQAVEPGSPALKNIAGYFGNQVLRADGTLDRKKLSDIVFQCPEKRKMLESFTHPPIYEEFFRQTREISAKGSCPVIQAVIPLLFELDLEYLVDKILLVYIPRTEQIKRLIIRDRIRAQEAARILSAQLPIDDKRERSDFVINNENSLQETEKQVKAFWQKISEQYDIKMIL